MSDKDINSSQFLERPPNWMLRYGIVAVFIFLIVVLIFSLVIKYNDVIKAEILITSENPPINLISKQEGRIVKTNYRPGHIVQKDEVLAIMENPSKYEDVYFLKSKLEDSIGEISSLNQLYENYPDNLVLDISTYTSYQAFLGSFGRYLLYLNLHEDQMETKNLSSQMSKLKGLFVIKKSQLKSNTRNYALSKSAYNRQVELFEKGVVSRQDLDRSEQELLAAKNEVDQSSQELERLNMDNLNLTNLSLKSLNRDIRNSSQYYSELQLAKQELKSKIKQWENLYVIKSPILGTVTVFDINNLYQNINKGEHLITVIPLQNSNPIGRCSVPIRNSGKLKNDQKVIIKLDNYPFTEWGTLSGTVKSISETPKKGREINYSVYVEIPNLRTSYGKNIIFKQEMYGTATIILDEVSLIERILYQFKGVWSDIQS